MSNKQHIVIICGVFYPEPSPTGLCVKRFADILINDFDIDIVCISSSGADEIINAPEGYKIYTLSGGVNWWEHHTNGLIKKMIHQVGRLQIKLLLLGNLNWYKKKIVKSLEHINTAHHIDTIFSISSPFAAHVATAQYREHHSETHWCAYTVDPYATRNRIRPLFYKFDDLVKKEKQTLLKSDILLISEEVYSSRKDLYVGHKNCSALPYMIPEVHETEKKINYFRKDAINCIYAGRFYENIRNPEPLLKAFSSLAHPKIKLHLFSVGCEKIVQKYVETYDNIIKHGFVSQELMHAIYNEADILVTVMNATNEFLPSKTFEYIATGKPIISFYSSFRYDDLCKYPLLLIIKENNIEDIEGLRDFILNSYGKKIEKREIERLYKKNSKEYIKELLVKALLSNP